MLCVKRWLLWFAIGVSTFIAFVLFTTGPGKPANVVEKVLAVALGGWGCITAIAVPVSVVAWLARRARPSSS